MDGLGTVAGYIAIAEVIRINQYNVRRRIHSLDAGGQQTYPDAEEKLFHKHGKDAEMRPCITER
jgi:hypothetical protein